jgi:hypothetical protein
MTPEERLDQIQAQNESRRSADLIPLRRYGVPGLLAAVRAVLDLHRPSTTHGPGYAPFCMGCWEAAGQDAAPSHVDCPTIAAIRKELE